MSRYGRSHSRDPAHFSYSSGYYDALTAYQQARAIGQPAGSAIYFAVDFNARGQLLENVGEYFRGIAAGLAAASGGNATYAVGVYGSGVVCDAIKRASLARYSWLSNSFTWEGSTTYDDWNIMQGAPSEGLSFNQDSDEARSDYGAFRIAGRIAGDPRRFRRWRRSRKCSIAAASAGRASADLLGREFSLRHRDVAGRDCHSPTRVEHSPANQALGGRPMDVGMMMVFASYGWDNIGDDLVWDEEIRLARLAASSGFDVLWSAEHHFFDYSFCPDNLQFCPIWRRLSACGPRHRGDILPGTTLAHRGEGCGARLLAKGRLRLGLGVVLRGESSRRFAARWTIRAAASMKPPR